MFSVVMPKKLTVTNRELLECIRSGISIHREERWVIRVHFNGHVSEGNTGDEVMSRFSFNERNLEG